MNVPGEPEGAEPSRAEVDSWPGGTVLEFGTSWCPICQAARPLIDAALAVAPALRHRRIEDGKGRPLGRSFRVTLWPTLVVLQDGVEIARVVRPRSQAEIATALAAIA